MLLVLCAHGIFGLNGYLTLRAREREVRQIENELRRLAEENKRLEQRIKRLRSDPKEIERIAREEMKLARPQEYIFLLPAPPEPSSPPASAESRPK